MVCCQHVRLYNPVVFSISPCSNSPLSPTSSPSNQPIQSFVEHNHHNVQIPPPTSPHHQARRLETQQRRTPSIPPSPSCPTQTNAPTEEGGCGTITTLYLHHLISRNRRNLASSLRNAFRIPPRLRRRRNSPLRCIAILTVASYVSSASVSTPDCAVLHWYESDEETEECQLAQPAEEEKSKVHGVDGFAFAPHQDDHLPRQPHPRRTRENRSCDGGVKGVRYGCVEGEVECWFWRGGGEDGWIGEGGCLCL